jgi:arylsulfatase A-like enzyme
VPQPQRIPQLVSLADLMPTLLARFELPGSELLVGQFEGEDVLSGAFTRDLALAERTADELRDGETGPQYALHSGRWKLIHRPEGKDQLFDMQGAGEREDVAAAHADVLAQLRAEARALLARRPALLPDPEPREADLELIEALEDLGYGGD